KAPNAARSPNASAAPMTSSPSAATISPSTDRGIAPVSTWSPVTSNAASPMPSSTLTRTGIPGTPNTGVRTNSGPRRRATSSTAAINALSEMMSMRLRALEVGGGAADHAGGERDELLEDPRPQEDHGYDHGDDLGHEGEGHLLHLRDDLEHADCDTHQHADPEDGTRDEQ